MKSLLCAFNSFADNFKEIQDTHNSDRLNEIQSLLGLELYSEDTELELLQKYRRDLEVDEYLSSPYCERMEGSRMDAMKNDEVFQNWFSSACSRMLLLLGYNNAAIYSAPNCWLSPLAINMISSIRQAPNAGPCAFYIPRLHNDDASFPKAVLSMVFQILSADKAVLQDNRHSKLLVEIRAHHDTIQRGEASQEAVQGIALKALNLFGPSTTIWLVVDCVDKCRKSNGQNDFRKRLLRTLVALVEKAKAKAGYLPS